MFYFGRLRRQSVRLLCSGSSKARLALRKQTYLRGAGVLPEAWFYKGSGGFTFYWRKGVS